MLRSLGPGPAPFSVQATETNSREAPAHVGVDNSHSTQVLFVNKDARSLFLPNSRPESKEIYSHVQRVAARSLRRQRMANLTSAAQARQIVRGPRTVTRIFQESVDPNRNGEDDQAATMQPHLYSANFNKGDHFDPFNSTSVHVNGEVHKILSYFMKVCVSTQFKFEVDARPSHKHHYAIYFDQMLRQCLENKLHMYTVLAAAAGRMTNLTHKQCSPVSPSIAQHFMCKAVECLRQYFASDENRLKDKHIIVTLICVSTFEWYIGDYEASSTHLRAIRHPFALLDESCDYDRWVIEMASHPDLYMAIETLSPPVLPAKGPGIYPRPIPISSVGQGFRELLDRKFFSAAMEPIVNGLLLCVRVWHTLPPSALLRDIIWTSQQIHFNLHQLLSIRSGAVLKWEEECCRITLIIILSYLITQTCKRSGMLNATRLQGVLRRIEPWPRDFAEQELLLWIMITGLFAAAEEEAADSLTEKVVQLAITLNFNTYTKLLGLMERFIWIEKLQEPFLHKLWTRIKIVSDQAGQDHNTQSEVEQFDGLEIAKVSAQISGIVARDYSESFQTLTHFS
jgi:hypothetical protein